MKTPKIDSLAWKLLVVKATATAPDKRTPEQKQVMREALFLSRKGQSTAEFQAAGNARVWFNKL